MNEHDRFSLSLSLLVSLAAILACWPHGYLLAADDPLTITHGTAISEITQGSVVFWARANRESYMQVSISAVTDGSEARAIAAVTQASADNDFTAKVQVTGLIAGTEYNYRIWFSETKDPDTGREQSQLVHGKFRTAPTADTQQAIRFAWGGDLAGQNVCRDREQGFPIFRVINQRQYDFFIGLGDMIYADALCEQTGLYGNEQIPGDFSRSADLENFRAHWRYNREDPDFLALLAKFPYYSIWDDHEVVNDFGPQTDIRNIPPYVAGERLMPIGLKAYLEYNPIMPQSPDSNRLYHQVVKGRHLELFFLDNRQYRDPNSDPDAENDGKTMLGTEQLQWLIDGLSTSAATWKVIVSSVPISIPTGANELGRDGWANFDQDTGFETEMWKLLNELRQNSVRNIIFITTDIHFGTGFRYRPFVDLPDFEFYEFATGPLNAGAYLRDEFDDSFGPRRLYHYGSNSIKTFDEAVRWFNFGQMDIDQEGNLQMDVINGIGESVYTILLPPRP